MNKVCPSDATKQKVVEFLNKASEEIILPFITKKYDKLAKKMNAYKNKMIMEREVIAEKAVWTAKKRYMLLVHDSEGVRYDTPKMKIMGIETSRSSTPQVVRDSLKEAIHLILTTNEQTIMNFVEEFREKFNNMSPEDIAFPRGVSNVEKYYDSNMIYQKATPIAVKGSLLYNHYIKKLKLSRKHREIINGDKIKFLHLKKPNPMGGVRSTDQVIAFPNSLPKEFGLEKYIDYDTQFSKSFLEPLKTILEKIGWKHEEQASLEGMFV
jgi:DNA polymerase elongation subunit (family B)